MIAIGGQTVLDSTDNFVIACLHYLIAGFWLYSLVNPSLRGAMTLGSRGKAGLPISKLSQCCLLMLFLAMGTASLAEGFRWEAYLEWKTTLLAVSIGLLVVSLGCDLFVHLVSH